MAFSLSPSVDVREFDLSLTIPNLPSAKTGMILPADKGPCQAITAIASESDLVNKFGKPTKDNAKEWFNGWNFLQYASSLYVVRPLPMVGTVAAENAALKFDSVGGVLTVTSSESYEKFYNEEVALGEIEYNHSIVDDKKLAFVNRSITSTQDLAVAVCSDPTYWDAPLAADLAVKGEIVFTPGVGGCVIDPEAPARPAYPAGATQIGVVDASGFAIGDSFVFGGKNIVVKGITGNVLTISPGLPSKVQELKTLTIMFDYTGGNYTAGVGVVLKYVDSIGTLTVGDTFVLCDPVGGTRNVVTITAHDSVASTITVDLPFDLAVVGGVEPAGYVPGLASYLRSYDSVYDSALVKKVVTGGSTVSTYIIGLGTVVTEELVSFNDLFEYEPEWANDEFVAVILQKVAGKYELAETFTGSYSETARDHSGRNMFMESVINSQSKLVYCIVRQDGDKIDTAPVALPKFQNSALTVGDPVTTQEVVLAEDLFRDPEAFDINILIASKGNLNGMSQIAESRKDCFAVVAPYEETDFIGKSATDATATLCNEFGVKTPLTGQRDFSTFGTYSAVYGNMKYQYDKFNDVNRWVSMAGDVAGIFAAMDADRDPWWAPAGLERGKAKNAIKLAVNPNKQNRDELQVNSINPIIPIPGEGNAVIWGQKTATAKPSAFDRINVRRLLITIEKAVATAARYGLFEFNDAFTRSRLFALIDPFLRTVQARRGVYDYLVVVDESNNTPDVIDANALVIDVYLKPTKVAEFIQVNMKVTRTDANFAELVGQAP